MRRVLFGLVGTGVGASLGTVALPVILPAVGFKSAGVEKNLNLKLFILSFLDYVSPTVFNRFTQKWPFSALTSKCNFLFESILKFRSRE